VLSIHQKLLDAQSVTGDSVSTPPAFAHTGCEDSTSLIEWGDGVSAGEVTVEHAHRPDYAGLWSVLAVFTFDGSTDPAPKTEYVRHEGPYRAIRHRITQEVLDGTVTTRIRGVED
jgi:hypothetical protein